MAPENINLSAALAPAKSSPLPRDPITKAPSMAFHTLPLPPNKEVPPITAAPIASSNKGPPANALNYTEAYLDAPIIPPTAAMKPTSANAEIRIYSMDIPTRLADSKLPPTSNMALP